MSVEPGGYAVSPVPSSRRRVLARIAAAPTALFAGWAMPKASASQNWAGLGRFSELESGTQWPEAAAEKGGWRLQTVSGVEPTRFSVTRDPDHAAGAAHALVLRADVRASAAALIHALPESISRANRLSWRWRADDFPAGELGTRSRDDFAARIYLMFDYPLDRMPWAQRWLMRAARSLHDPNLPAATLVYLLHAGKAPAVSIDSPYSSRVKMLAVRAEAARGRWYAESRNIHEDFRQAFGAEYGAGTPPLSAIAVGADGDQTRAGFTSWFGDLSLRAD